MIRGRAKIDAIALTEVTIRFAGPESPKPAELEATARFLSSQGLTMHGETHMRGIFSARTKLLLEQLGEALEADLARFHFEGDGVITPPPQPPKSTGLGEMFPDGDAPEG